MLMAINRITIILAIINITINIVTQTENTIYFSMAWEYNKTYVISRWSKDLLYNIIKTSKYQEELMSSGSDTYKEYLFSWKSSDLLTNDIWLPKVY